MKYIVMRGRRFNDLRSWNLDPQTKAELRAKGVIKNYGTGGILLTASCPLNEILIVPDEAAEGLRQPVNIDLVVMVPATPRTTPRAAPPR